ncbi:hypothetical protein CAQUA_08645 [Corynebacterium aquatimens]|uniref:Uncharacterized protein n=1 Tax=Corynebacterium aquatimens TaxID=1190508 RepID=A0A931GY43_9CORY|nr:hypothetical protein [Corynebacterium aquatimens]WJY66419.1 hypothetical protein CAQUA_08645 [Corynebacterium aquatimens]
MCLTLEELAESDKLANERQITRSELMRQANAGLTVA